MPSVITPCGGSGGGWALLQDFQPIAPVTGFDFTSIDQTYTHLALILDVRSTRAAPNTADYVRVNFNGDSSSVYYAQQLYGQGATPFAQEYLVEAFGRLGYAAAVSAPNYARGSIVAFFPHYRNVQGAKQWTTSNMLVAGTTSGNLVSTTFGGVWLKSPPEAITELNVTPDLGGFFEASSVASLYGLV